MRRHCTECTFCLLITGRRNCSWHGRFSTQHRETKEATESGADKEGTSEWSWKREVHIGERWWVIVDDDLLQTAALDLLRLAQISAHLQIIWQTCWATAIRCWPASAWGRERRRSPPNPLRRRSSSGNRRPKTSVEIQTRKEFGARSLEITCGARLSVPSPGLPFTTPATNLDLSCGPVAPCRCPRRRHGIALRVWYRNWTANSLICPLRKQAALSQICSSQTRT